MITKKISEKAIEKSPKKIRKWLILILVLLYVFSPIDLIPDIFPPVTYLDDLGLIILAIMQFLNKGDSNGLFKSSQNKSKISNNKKNPEEDSEIIDGEIIKD